MRGLFRTGRCRGPASSQKLSQKLSQSQQSATGDDREPAAQQRCRRRSFGKEKEFLRPLNPPPAPPAAAGETRRPGEVGNNSGNNSVNISVMSRAPNAPMTTFNDQPAGPSRRPEPIGLLMKTHWRIAVVVVVIYVLGGSTAVLAALVGGYIAYTLALEGRAGSE